MSIQQSNVIDIAGTEASTGNVILTISDHLDWENEAEHLLLLQNKINSYVHFYEGGRLLTTIPNTRERRVVIRVVHKYKPTILADEFYDRVKIVLNELNLTLEVVTLTWPHTTHPAPAPPPMPPLHPATPQDAPRIAALHARSWQENYTDAMSAIYLQQEAPAERLAVWTERFAHPAPGMRVLLAENDGQLIGFSCFFLDHHPEDGTLLDNLHVRADQQGSGLGRHLMQATARLTLAEGQSDKLYLWVLDSNIRARTVYERLGGRVGRSECHRMPGTGPEGVSATSMHWRAGELLE